MKSHYLPGILFILLLPIFLQAQEAAPDGNQGGQHTIFLEALGSNGFGSLNYEYRFAQKGKWGMAVRGGGYYVPTVISKWYHEIKSSRHSGANVGFSLIQGNGPHYLEFGLGASALFYSHQASPYIYICTIETIDLEGQNESIQIAIMRAIETNWDRHLDQSFTQSLKVGYRFQKPTGGLFLQGSLMAIHFKYRRGNSFLEGTKEWEQFQNGVVPFAGLSVGYTFR